MSYLIDGSPSANPDPLAPGFAFYVLAEPTASRAADVIRKLSAGGHRTIYYKILRRILGSARLIASATIYVELVN